ncbi:hypothetical protein D3C76_856630 [compost metagenome]
MQCANRFRQAHHTLRQFRWQQFGDGAGLEQFKRLVGQLAQRRLLDAFRRGINGCQRFL